MIADSTLDELVRFHGHLCPGLALGVRAAEVALERLGGDIPQNDMVAVVETDLCGVDAIQYLTGCTYGTGSLIHRDHGKNAFSFVRRSDGRGIRVSTPQGGWRRDPEWEQLFGKIRAGTATDEDRQRFQSVHTAQCHRILAAPLTDLYEVTDVEIEVPRRMRIVDWVDCSVCAEPTAETHIRFFGGRQMCPPCFERAER